MREIKFRVWDADSTEMVVDGVGIDISGIAYVDNPLTDDSTYYPDCPIMQNTGLKDKNGAEIYEGDIIWYGITYANSKYMGEVVYDEAGFNLKSPIASELLPLWGASSIEVIGNIYSNPELLEKP